MLVIYCCAATGQPERTIRPERHSAKPWGCLRMCGCCPLLLLTLQLRPWWCSGTPRPIRRIGASTAKRSSSRTFSQVRRPFGGGSPLEDAGEGRGFAAAHRALAPVLGHARISGTCHAWAAVLACLDEILGLSPVSVNPPAAIGGSDHSSAATTPQTRPTAVCPPFLMLGTPAFDWTWPQCQWGAFESHMQSYLPVVIDRQS